MATHDTPTTFTCSCDKGAFGKSIFLIADLVAPVSTRKRISRPSIVKVSLGSSRGFEVSNGNSDEVPSVLCHKVNGIWGGGGENKLWGGNEAAGSACVSHPSC